MSETIPGGQVVESVTKAAMVGADGPLKCGKSEGRLSVAPMMDWTDGAVLLAGSDAGSHVNALVSSI